MKRPQRSVKAEHVKLEPFCCPEAFCTLWTYKYKNEPEAVEILRILISSTRFNYLHNRNLHQHFPEQSTHHLVAMSALSAIALSILSITKNGNNYTVSSISQPPGAYIPEGGTGISHYLNAIPEGGGVLPDGQQLQVGFSLWSPPNIRSNAY